MCTVPSIPLMHSLTNNRKVWVLCGYPNFIFARHHFALVAIHNQGKVFKDALLWQVAAQG